MDEVDGMSAGDRGGVGALAALIRKTKVTFFFSFRKRGRIERSLDSYHMHRQ
jgi:replication factor C subunit 1